ncbi:MAG: hypothetical protein Q4D07_03420 [Selenomonadaceae bacterium]|nr:hypothetical protein [Selenomonadaceae bacterium]
MRYVEESDPLGLNYGQEYEVLGIQAGCYQIVDNTGEDYLYVPEEFEIVSGSVDEYEDKFKRD